jgi:hypothetical protein
MTDQTVYCTNDTRKIGSESHLYVPTGIWWERTPKQIHILDVIRSEMLRYMGMYETRQGLLYFDRKVSWRILNPSRPATLCPDSRLWHNSFTGDPILAEPVTYELLRLEAIFLVGDGVN